MLARFKFINKCKYVLGLHASSIFQAGAFIFHSEFTNHTTGNQFSDKKYWIYSEE